MNLKQTTPQDLEPATLTDRNTLVLGAPYLGKSHLFRESNTDHKLVKRVHAAFDSRDDEFVVIDEFYTAYQSASLADQQSFESWLDREGCVCLVVRPREIDWMLANDDSVLSETILDKFDDVYFLRYQPDIDTDQEQAVHCCLSIAHEDVDAPINREDVEEHLDDLFLMTDYRFENSTLRDHFGTDSYGETIVPALIVYFSDKLADGDGAILPDNVREVCRDIGEAATVGQFLNETKDACSNLFSQETLAKLESLLTSYDETGYSALSAVSGTTLSGLMASVGPPALVAGGSLALYLRLREDNELSQEAVYQVLLGEELTPTARADLEAELNLPPRTIDNFQRVVKGNTVERLLQHRERLSEELDDVENHLEEVERAVEIYEEDLQTLTELFSTLEDTAIDHTDIVSFIARSITEAATDSDDFDASVRREEEDILQVGSLESSPPYYGNEIKHIVKAIIEDNQDMITLRGPHGTGKTTAACQACKLLSERGYDVKLPNFDNSSPNAIQYSLTASDKETVVFAFYKRGSTGGNSIRDVHDLRQLLVWLNKGYCSTVILECRDELYRSLTSLIRDIEDRQLKKLWQAAEEVEFEPLANDDQVESVVKWVLDELQWNDDREQIIEEATNLAEGNPEIAKIAARFAITEDEPLRDVETYDDLIWNDIDVIFDTDSVMLEDGRAIGGRVFEFTSATRRIRTDELLEMIGGSIRIDHLQTCARYLSGYLGADVRERVEGTDKELATKDRPFLESINSSNENLSD